MNINYIIDDDIEFFKEINNDEFLSDNEEDNVCLISQTPLSNNTIKLSCNHSFNYRELYKEVVKQKQSKRTSMDPYIVKLREHEFLCPYCRQKQHKLLPNIKTRDGINLIYGVNAPAKYCMPHNQCQYITKSGKNKGQPCDKSGFNYDHGCYCFKHALTKPVKICKAVLKSGKNKGNQCSCKAVSGSDFCKRHG